MTSIYALKKLKVISVFSQEINPEGFTLFANRDLRRVKLRIPAGEPVCHLCDLLRRDSGRGFARLATLMALLWAL